MLPSDVLGVTIYNAHAEAFEFKRGPVFTNFLLADEINRTTPKTQSALLEAMNEGQVTIDGRPHSLPRPFMVIATQNPVEHHGTYPLPESQMDRFLMRLRIGYPDAASEREILRNFEMAPAETVRPALSGEDILRLQTAVQGVVVEESLVDYMLAIVASTRAHESLTLGVSPRGSQALFRAVQALALVEGREYAIPDDVKRLAVPVFAHRVVVNTRTALAQRRSDLGDRIIEEILSLTDVPL
jgi:MoxR-like ATPase